MSRAEQYMHMATDVRMLWGGNGNYEARAILKA